MVLGLRARREAVREGPADPPPEVTVIPDDRPPSPRRKPYMKDVEAFVDEGFEPVGDFRFREWPDYRLHLLLDASREWIGIVYEHPLAGVWCDVFTAFRNGETLTVSSAPFGEAQDSPPGWHKVLRKGARVAELMDEAGRIAGVRGRRRHEPASLPRIVEETYAEEMAWRRSRERTSQNVRRLQLLRIEEAALARFRDANPDAPPDPRLMAVPETLTGLEFLARIEARRWLPAAVAADLAADLRPLPTAGLEGLAPAGGSAFRLLDIWLDEPLAAHGIQLVGQVDRPVPTRILEKLPGGAPPPPADEEPPSGSRP
jgi:hypothetical protein